MAIDANIMDWNDTIEDDGKEFVILPEGDYTFTVTNFERGRFPGSVKIPACNKAVLTLSFDNDMGNATARIDLILYRTLEWKLASFFRSIGAKQHGEKVIMDWNKVVGARGRAHVAPRNYTGRDGQARQTNDVVRFLEHDVSVACTPVDNADLPWDNGNF